MQTKESVISLILHMYYHDQVFSYLKPLTRSFFNSLNLLIDTRGISFAVTYLKRTRLAVTRYISGEPLDILDGVRLKGGWPVWVNNLKVLLKDPETIRYLLTLLTVLRDTRLKSVLLTDPITDEWKGVLPSITKREHLTILKELGITRKQVKWSRYHMSTKKGPSGQAIWTSISDLRALPDKLIDNIKSIAGSPLKSHIDAIQAASLDGHSLQEMWLTLFPHPEGKDIRKLSYFSDKEGKSRVIAILDYWSQTALKPLHDTLNGILKGIRVDCTFNQNHFLKVLPNQPGTRYHSIDLSNATDRMPIALQKKVIASIIGRTKADAWASILTDWSYPCRERPDGVKYRTGQPMGAYSSWPAMALTHHYIVKLAALRSNKKDFWDYCLLGDDIVIADATVASQYRELLVTLDMPVSEQKTHTSEIVYEFAKRWVYQGEEVTPYSVGGLLESYSKYPYLHNFFETQGLHGWGLPKDRHPELVRSIYRIMGRPQQGERSVKLYMLFDALSEIKKVGVFNNSAYKVLEQYFGFPSLDPSEASSLSEKVIKDARIEMLQTDMGNYEAGLYVGLTNINTLFSQNYPGLDATAYRQLNRSHMPLIMAVNDKVDDSMDLICMLYDPDTPVERLLDVEGIGKYSISKDIFFNLRDSRSMLLAFSRLVKAYIAGVKAAVKGNQTPDH